MLDMVGVQVRWDGGGTEPAGEYRFLYGRGNENHELAAGFFVHKKIILAVKRVQFVTDRMAYIILRGPWCDIALLVHVPTWDKNDNMKGSYYEDMEHVFHKFPKYHRKCW
jgi:hypothetical protein